MHRVDRADGGGLEVPAVVQRDLDDVEPLLVHAREEIELVRHALVREELRAFIGDVRLFALAERNLPREGRVVLAPDVVVEVGRRKQHPAV